MKEQLGSTPFGIFQEKLEKIDAAVRRVSRFKNILSSPKHPHNYPPDLPEVYDTSKTVELPESTRRVVRIQTILKKIDINTLPILWAKRSELVTRAEEEKQRLLQNIVIEQKQVVLPNGRTLSGESAGVLRALYESKATQPLTLDELSKKVYQASDQNTRALIHTALRYLRPILTKSGLKIARYFLQGERGFDKTSVYILESVSRKQIPLSIRFMALLGEHQMAHPDRPILLKNFAERLGVTRQRMSQLYAQLEQQGEKLLPLWKHWVPSDIASFDADCSVLKSQGKNTQEIAQQLSVPIRAVLESRRRTRSERKRIEPEKLASIRTLRQQGLGNKEIGERLQLSTSRVTHLLKKLIDADETLRLRKKRRTKQEINTLTIRIKKLRNDGLTNEQIVAVLGKEVDLYAVVNVVRKLIRTGETVPKNEKVTSLKRRANY